MSAVLVAGGDAAAHFRQQHSAGGEADDAIGQLIDAIGVSDRGDAAVRQHGGDDRIGENGDLPAGRADHRRPQHQEEFAHAPPMRPRQPFHHADHAGVGHQQGELQDAGDGHAPGGGIGRAGKEECDGERRNHGEIEQIGREGRRRKSAIGVQRALMKRHQSHAEQIGKGDARQRNGELEFLRPIVEARREQRHELRHEGVGENEQHDLRGEQKREHLAREFFRRVFPCCSSALE